MRSLWERGHPHLLFDAQPLGAWASRPRPAYKAYIFHRVFLITLYAGRRRDACAPRGIRVPYIAQPPAFFILHLK